MSSAKRSLILSMLVFGTIGIFRNYIPLSSSMLAMLRGFIGTAFLLVFVKVRHIPVSRQDIRKNLPLLAASGILIGLNWILLFESYRFTSVAVATLCYYMAPVIVILLAPLVLKEKLTVKKAVCAALAFLGMVLVSGVLSAEPLASGALKGILLGLGAACLYAGVVLINKKLGPIGAYDKTMVQLFFAAVILLPYNLFAGSAADGPLTPLSILLVAIVGIVHTGISYTMYFGSISALPAQTAALYSYIDPVTAIFLSLLIFRENIGLTGFLGAALILGSTLFSDLTDSK